MQLILKSLHLYVLCTNAIIQSRMSVLKFPIPRKA